MSAAAISSAEASEDISNLGFELQTWVSALKPGFGDLASEVQTALRARGHERLGPSPLISRQGRRRALSRLVGRSELSLEPRFEAQTQVQTQV